MDISPLSELSRENRNQVYGHILGSRKRLTVSLPYVLKNSSPPEQSAFQPAITRTYKQLRSESLLMFYAVNKFEVVTPHGLHDPRYNEHREYFDYRTGSTFIRDAIALACMRVRWTPQAQYKALGQLSLEMHVNAAPARCTDVYTNYNSLWDQLFSMVAQCYQDRFNITAMLVAAPGITAWTMELNLYEDVKQAFHELGLKVKIADGR